MPNSNFVIDLQNLSFSYRNQIIFENLNYQITGNQFVGIIGLNGCGKSTLLKLIMGLLPAKTGHIQILNQPAGHYESRLKVGSSLQDIDFPGTEKVEEVINFVCAQFPNPLETEKLITDFNLNDFRKKPCGQLSGGMKRRLALACAFAGRPQVVLLDEPTTGLDSDSRHLLMKNIKSYQKEYAALVLMISHHPQEVAQHMDHFFHIKNGTIHSLSSDYIEELSQLRRIEFLSQQNLPPFDALKMEKTQNSYTVIVKESDQFLKWLCKENIEFKNLMIHPLGADELMQEIL